MAGPLSLPNELLTEVFRRVLPEDLKRTFMVTKRWYAVAQEVFFEHVIVDLTNTNLDMLPWIKKLKSIAHQKVCSFAIRMPCDPCYQRRREYADLPDLSTADGVYASLGGMLAKMVNLKRFELTSRQLEGHDPRAEHWPNARSQLDVRHIIEPLLGLDSLQVVHIDISGHYTSGGSRPRGGMGHLCPLVRKIWLKGPQCRVRVPVLCPAIFSLPDTQEEDGRQDPRPACEMILNIQHPPSSSAEIETGRTFRCRGRPRYQTPIIPFELSAAARELYAAVPGIAKLRILYACSPFRSHMSRNIVTGDLAVCYSEDWDDEGDLVDDDNNNENSEEDHGVSDDPM